MTFFLVWQRADVRKSCVIVAAVLATALLLSTQALACFGRMQPSTQYSEEPVTIKIASTYFEIPEKLISYGSPPADVDSIKLWIDVPPKREVTLLSKSRAKQLGYHEGMVDVTEDTVFASYFSGVGNEEIRKYLLSIASRKPPATWEDDIKLWKRLTGPPVTGESACGQLEDFSAGAIATNLFEHLAHWIYTKITYTETNVLAGLQHRNAVLRNRALQIVTSEGFKSDPIKAALIKIAQSDIDLDLRSEAIQILGSQNVDDTTVISTLRELAKDATGKQAQSQAIAALAKTDPDFVEFILPLIPDATPELTRAISSGLATAIYSDYQKNKPSSYEQFSPKSKQALQAEMKMLLESQDSATKYHIISNFQTYRNLIITPEYIEFLNKLALDNDLQMVRIAITALEWNGLKPKDTPQVISHLEKFLNLPYRNIYIKPIANGLIKKLNEPIVIKDNKSDDPRKLRQLEYVETYYEDKNYWLVQ